MSRLPIVFKAIAVIRRRRAASATVLAAFVDELSRRGSVTEAVYGAGFNSRAADSTRRPGTCSG